MTLRDRLKTRIPRPTFTPFSSAPARPDGAWEMLRQLAEKMLREKFVDIDARVESFLSSAEVGADEAKSALIAQARKDIKASTALLKDEAEKVIAEHIQTRAIEIRGENGYTPQKGKDYFDGTPGEPGKPGEPGMSIKGDPGKDAALPSEEDIRAMFEPMLKAMFDELAKRLHKASGKQLYGGGGGSSSSSGGANVADELLTTGLTQNGDDVDINLSVLTHSYTTILQVRRNGTPQVRGISWTQVGSTVTVKGADAGELFEIQYTYA